MQVQTSQPKVRCSCSRVAQSSRLRRGLLAVLGAGARVGAGGHGTSAVGRAAECEAKTPWKFVKWSPLGGMSQRSRRINCAAVITRVTPRFVSYA